MKHDKKWLEEELDFSDAILAGVAAPGMSEEERYVWAMSERDNAMEEYKKARKHEED